MVFIILSQRIGKNFEVYIKIEGCRIPIMLLKNNLSAPFFSKIRSLLFHMHEVLSKNSIFQHMYSKRFCGVVICLGLFAQGFGQSTALVVYDIVQTNCANAYCHSNGTQAGGLDQRVPEITSVKRWKMYITRSIMLRPTMLKPPLKGISSSIQEILTVVTLSEK